MEQEERKRISFMLAGGDEIISEYEKHIEGYRELVEAGNRRIKELEEENMGLREKLYSLESDVTSLYRNHCSG